MVNGKQKAARFLVVAQANLVWASEGTDIQGFIETGSLGNVEMVEASDPVMREAMVAGLEGRGEEFVNDLIRKAQADQLAKETQEHGKPQ